MTMALMGAFYAETVFTSPPASATRQSCTAIPIRYYFQNPGSTTFTKEHQDSALTLCMVLLKIRILKEMQCRYLQVQGNVI